MSMKTKMMLASGLGIMLAVGCSPSVETNPPGSGGSTSSSGSNTTTGSTSVSTGTGGTCPGFEDATGTDTVTVRFRNNAPRPIYLPVGCKSINFSIEPVTGPDGVTYNYDGSCLQTCEDLQKNPPFACDACAPQAFRLDVGATREVTWEGAGLKSGIPMPASCWAAPGSNENCSQVVAAPAASYRLSATGYASCGASCTCDAQGVCAGYAEGAKAHASQVKFNYPADKVVEVVFEGCAFGCPEDD